MRHEHPGDIASFGGLPRDGSGDDAAPGARPRSRPRGGTRSTTGKASAPKRRAAVATAGTAARPVYPFSAIVGQPDLTGALLIAAVDPGIGGVLILGDRGTGKSTAVRGLARLLPDIDVIPGCSYNCAPGRAAGVTGCGACSGRRRPQRRSVPVVDLPLGASEDRLIGSLDIERVLTHGERSFAPGLLAQANRGFLYIDEVNLLEDHLVDALLDVAASGVNVVERDGLSVRHPARFVLVGSGNPEEGELRPQMLDRFGLAVDIATPRDVAQRVEIIKRRDAFDRDPEAFVAAHAAAESELRGRIVAARESLDGIRIGDEAYERAAELCMAVGTDGLRGELTLIRAARARAALGGSDAVDADALLAVAPMALRHRLRKDPLDETGTDARLARALDSVRSTPADPAATAGPAVPS
jgi:magnesium chelatase subunit I